MQSSQHICAASLTLDSSPWTWGLQFHRAHHECASGLQGATVLDFAYHVHTDVGNHMIGAKVNGKYVMASHQLANAEIVDILTYDGPLTKNLLARHQVCGLAVGFACIAVLFRA